MSQTEIFSSPTRRRRTINFRVTIDTDSISQPADRPGDVANPMSIARDHGYMVVTASQGVENQGTGDVVFDADAGDTLRFFISSGANNFEQAVLLEEIRHASGDDILKDFKSQILEATVIAPHSQTDVLPARLVKKRFQFYHCIIANYGTGSYDLVFALYDRNEEGQPRLISHYRWAIQLTAHSNRREP